MEPAAMHPTALMGVVEGGRIRIPDPVTLPDQTEVIVVVANAQVAQRVRLATPRLVKPEQAGDFVLECCPAR